MSIGQLLTQVFVLDANAASAVLHKLARVTSEVVVRPPVLVRVALLLPPVHEEEHKAAKGDADEGEVVASLVVLHVDVQVASERKSQEKRKCSSSLNEAPAAWEMLRSDSLKRENLEDVVKAAKKDPVHPDKEEVAMVALQGAESQNGEADAEDGGLEEVLARDEALLGPGHHKEAKGKGAGSYPQPDEGLQENRLVLETFGQGHRNLGKCW